jgi:hypothetical protein
MGSLAVKPGSPALDAQKNSGMMADKLDEEGGRRINDSLPYE